MPDSEGFLGRWSRRKAQAKQSAELAKDDPALEPVTRMPVVPGASVTPPVIQDPVKPPSPPDTPVEKPALTLNDVRQLTTESDFSPFVARDVPADVRNAAMKKLFADPKFNVMDGLDIYIDDYSKPNPLPVELARKMVSAHFMNLFDEPSQAGEKAQAHDPVPAADSSPPRAEPAAEPRPGLPEAEPVETPPAMATREPAAEPNQPKELP